MERRAHTADDRPLLAWIALACALLFAAMAAPFFLGRVYAADDLGAFHLPVRNFYADQLARGESFDWIPSLYSGFYLTGEGQVGAYHPLHWLLYRALPLGAAFNIELLLSYPAMLLGCYVWLLGRLARRDAALFGAMAFTFSGFNLLHFVHPNAIAIVAHIPWLLWLIDRLVNSSTRAGRTMAAVGIAALTGSQLLLGYPQYVWLSLLAEGAYVLWRTSGAPRRTALIGQLLAAKALGLLIGAAQILPTADLLAHSTRQAATADFVNYGSLHPLNLLQLVAPYLFKTRVVGQNTHELGLYVGAVPLVLVVWLALNHRRWGALTPLVRVGLAMAVFALLLALGEHGGIYRLQHFLPLVNHFRFPCRAIVLVDLSVAVLGAAAVALLTTPLPLREGPGEGNGQINRSITDTAVADPTRYPLPTSPLKGEESSRTRLWPLVVLSIFVAIASCVLWPEFVAAPALIAVGPAIFAAAVFLVSKVERRSRAALVGLVLLTAIDLGVYGMSVSVWPKTFDLNAYVAATPLPPGEPTRVAATAPTANGQTRELTDRLLLAGWRRADGYAGLEPARRLDLRQANALRLADVSWITESGDWRPAPRGLSRARLVTEAIVADPAEFDQADFDVSRAAIVDEPVSLTAGAPGMATIQSDRPGSITVKAESSGRQLLTISESWHPGWEATMDGAPCPVMRVNGDFLGCVVEPGLHQVHLEFRPKSLRRGVALSACGLGLMVGWMLLTMPFSTLIHRRDKTT